MIHLTVCAHF